MESTAAEKSVKENEPAETIGPVLSESVPQVTPTRLVEESAPASEVTDELDAIVDPKSINTSPKQGDLIIDEGLDKDVVENDVSSSGSSAATANEGMENQEKALTAGADLPSGEDHMEGATSSDEQEETLNKSSSQVLVKHMVSKFLTETTTITTSTEFPTVASDDYDMDDAAADAEANDDTNASNKVNSEAVPMAPVDAKFNNDAIVDAMVNEIIDIVDTTIDIGSTGTNNETTPLPTVEESDLDEDNESSVAAAARVLLKSKSPEIGCSSFAKAAVEATTVEPKNDNEQDDLGPKSELIAEKGNDAKRTSVDA
ncbi:hypothetical protein D0Z03_000035 [Geotrichum reessii]|nr:hypothetical protein D0Z03_000035 [Galactomyces reessii]